MKSLMMLLSLPLLLSLLVACGKEVTTGPVDVRWDREVCARCAMALSDHKFAAEVRGGRPDKKAKVYKFDDIGCAVIWLDKQQWKDAPRTEIWVKDHTNDAWLDARKAWYVPLPNSPMDYGLGAQQNKVAGALDFAQAKKHIYEVEQRFNPHTGQPRQIETITADQTPAATSEPVKNNGETNKK